MELKKVRESVVRTYDNENNDTERVTNVNYQILDSNGSVIGHVDINEGGNANANFSISGFGTIAEGQAKVEELFGGLNG